MTEYFRDSVPPGGSATATESSRLAGRAALDLYFGMIGRNSAALKLEVAKLAIALERHRAIVVEAQRSAK